MNESTQMILKSQRKIFYIGDPFYIIPDSKEVERLAAKGLIFVHNTAEGDGFYGDKSGNDFPVDSGWIGCVPIEQAPDLTADGGLVVSSSSVECAYIEGVFTFMLDHAQSIVIDTNGETFDPDDFVMGDYDDSNEYEDSNEAYLPDDPDADKVEAVAHMYGITIPEARVRLVSLTDEEVRKAVDAFNVKDMPYELRPATSKQKVAKTVEGMYDAFGSRPSGRMTEWEVNASVSVRVTALIDAYTETSAERAARDMISTVVRKALKDSPLTKEQGILFDYVEVDIDFARKADRIED